MRKAKTKVETVPFIKITGNNYEEFKELIIKNLCINLDERIMKREWTSNQNKILFFETDSSYSIWDEDDFYRKYEETEESKKQNSFPKFFKKLDEVINGKENPCPHCYKDINTKKFPIEYHNLNETFIIINFLGKEIQHSLNYEFLFILKEKLIEVIDRQIDYYQKINDSYKYRNTYRPMFNRNSYYGQNYYVDITELLALKERISSMKFKYEN